MCLFYAQLAQLQVELQRMNAENKKLKEMLSHVSGNYTALQMHLVALMQKNQHTENTENEVINYKFYISLVSFNCQNCFNITAKIALT